MHRKTPVLESIKITGRQAPVTLLKKRLQRRRFLVKIAKIFKNNCFGEHLRTATSGFAQQKKAFKYLK